MNSSIRSRLVKYFKDLEAEQISDVFSSWQRVMKGKFKPERLFCAGNEP